MPRKCIVVGMDGVSPHLVRHLISEGRLPNLKRMMEEGVFAPHFLSSLPTSTPENWTTISTGAWNGTHQVMSFQTFRPPELHGRWMAGYTSAETQAEFIWDALERAGKQTILLKYPASHPPTMSTGVQVCGCHVKPCAHQIDGAHMFATEEPRNAALTLAPHTGSADIPSRLPILSGTVLFEARGIGGEAVGEGMDERSTLYGVPDGKEEQPTGVTLATPVCKILPPGQAYHLFVVSRDGTGYDRVVLTKDAAGRQKLAELGPGEWSEWITDTFHTIDGDREGSFRLKLQELSPDGKSVRLYATQVMDVDGYASPPGVGRELFEAVGPFITDIAWEGLGHYGASSWIDESVMLDLADYQHDWFVRAIEYLTRTRDWSLLMMQAHAIDCANHHGLNVADPHANPTDRVEGDRHLEFIKRLMDSLDTMVGRILDLADDDTAVFVISDHGGLPGDIRVDHRAVLEQAGLLVRGPDGQVDWSRSRAYLTNGLFVNVNLQGREPQGIVPPQEYEKTLDEIMAALHAYVEPRTGLHPYNLVLRKADMRYVGLYGDPTNQKIGDVLFTLKERFGGNHGEQLSTAVWGLGSNTSLLLMRGSGIRRGVELDRTVWLTDIVPTICALLDTPVPRDCQGAIIYQALEDAP
jgi:predicted AlkP superfamily phosphohydrolase/phosphomutase